MSEARIRKTAISAVAQDRPPGYEADVLSAAVREDDTFVWIPREVYDGLKVKYAPKPPSLLQKVKNFTKSAVKHVKAGMPMASEEEIARRYAICQGCEFLKDNACLKCGCPVVREKNFISKLSWGDEKCPVGHW